MSSNQWIGQFGATAAVDVTEDLFKEMINSVGFPLELYQQKQTIDCTCIDPTYKTADRHCSICEGTGSIGGFQKEPDHAFLGIIQVHDRRGRQDGQRLHSKLGPVDTFEGVLYTEARWFERINIDDLIVWKPKGSSIGYELRIISKDPQIGMLNEIIYGKFEFVKNPYPVRKDASDYRRRI